MTTKVAIQHVSKIFGPRPKEQLHYLEGDVTRETFAEKTGHSIGIRDVSLEVKEGEIFVIMGLSGSGKSTLIRCLNLLNEPTAGKILVDGEDITAYNNQQLKAFRQNKIAMVFQNFGLFSHRTVAENVGYGLEIRKVPLKERERLIKESIEAVGLKGSEEKYPDELSGGMQQRVGLARAVANDPDILLMDEPFSALDPLIRREMQEELLVLQKKLKKTIIFITHDVNEAFKIGNRVAVMKAGKIEQINTPLEILKNPANPYIEAFVKDIDRAKVLQLRDILKPSVTFTEEEAKRYVESYHKVDASLYIQDVLEKVVASPEPLIVMEDTKPLGLLTKEKVLEYLI